ncbi:helix-turn-helix domain-containing protein [Actinoplanes couchii]|uniref:Transcriptional regulator n=1 Tax=Actinoplanes couchii TaxID=403638 RepID=A0ABQ3XRG9_9ACTN|nr:helix-turn-helix transcriptional regulator [Actinoplanes couchii]MDR6321484.1 transcriptional regulator with XRE-family HTH domain [Actinoplanes couchii]GID61108.1 transcriptional regulator [Actinoplanes couchii]
MGSAGALNPIAASRLLRADLRRVRETVGLTQAQVAELLEWSVSKVTRIENGDVGISINDLRALCLTLEIGSAATEELLRRAQAARRRGWWHDDRAEIPPAMLHLIGLEAEADSMAEYTSGFVSGLLQTRDYTEALLHSALPGAGRDRLERRTAIRMQRQEKVHEKGDPPDMNMVIDEAVLYRRIGDAGIMADQMRKLIELARRPYMALRVIPFESPAFRAESFALLRSELMGTVVYCEKGLGDVLIEDAATVGQFESQMTGLWNTSLDADQTSQLLHRVASGYESGDVPRPWLWE